MAKGLWNQFQPESTTDIEDWRYDVKLRWRRTRMAKAEDEEVESRRFSMLGEIEAAQREFWDDLRAGETTGGMLRHSSNPLIVREAIARLTDLKNALMLRGFCPGAA